MIYIILFHLIFKYLRVVYCDNRFQLEIICQINFIPQFEAGRLKLWYKVNFLAIKSMISYRASWMLFILKKCLPLSASFFCSSPSSELQAPIFLRGGDRQTYDERHASDRRRPNWDVAIWLWTSTVSNRIGDSPFPNRSLHLRVGHSCPGNIYRNSLKGGTN